MARRKGLSEDDLRVWAAYGRTLTRLLPGKTRLPVPPEPAARPDPQPLPPEPKKPVLKAAPAPVGIGTAPGGLDKSTWRRFRGADMRVEARLDLHGHTAARAHAEVMRFICHGHALGLRHIEIITGNGEILVRELPHWLNAPSLRPFVLAVTYSHARNTGALRILLRRVRGP
jgi:DNA-nicking Smr family endonuclease